MLSLPSLILHFLCPLLQTSSSCLRPQVLLSEGSRGQTSDCTPKLCPWHPAAAGKHVSGNIRYECIFLFCYITHRRAKREFSFWLLQGFIPMVVPDVLKGAVFVSTQLCAHLHSDINSLKTKASLSPTMSRSPRPLLSSLVHLQEGCGMQPNAHRSQVYSLDPARFPDLNLAGTGEVGVAGETSFSTNVNALS